MSEQSQRKGSRGGPVAGYKGTLTRDAEFREWTSGKGGAVLTLEIAMNQVDGDHTILRTDYFKAKLWYDAARKHHAHGA